MIVVLFEVTVKRDCMDQYLALAGDLKESLAKAEGFIRAERFSSFSTEGKLLSLSVWENEGAVEKWRNREQHRMTNDGGVIPFLRGIRFRSYLRYGRILTRNEWKHRKTPIKNSE